MYEEKAGVQFRPPSTITDEFCFVFRACLHLISEQYSSVMVNKKHIGAALSKIFSNDEVSELQSGLSASDADVRAIEAALMAKLQKSDSPLVLIRRDYLQSFGELMREAAQGLEKPETVRTPLADELDGSGYMIDEVLGKKKAARPSLS